MEAHRLALLGAFGIAGCCLQLGAPDSGGGTSSSSGGSGSATTGGAAPCTMTGCQPQCDGLEPQICDPEDGRCKCYLGGPPCDEGCDSYGDCVGAVTCLPCIVPCFDRNTVCDPDNGACDCGELGGPTCKNGTCRLFWADSGEPVPPNGNTGHAPIVGRCTGSYDPCYQVTCPPLEACDPDDTYPENGTGRCACGRDAASNSPGVVCAIGDICIATVDGGPPECLRVCRPFGEPCSRLDLPDASVPIALSCYDFPPGPFGTACARPTGDLALGQKCQRPTDCAPTLTCMPSAGAMTCVAFCDTLPPGYPVTDDAGIHGCPPGSVCVPLPDDSPAGTCQPG